MKSFDLKQTKENLIEKLKEDSLGRNNAIYRFIRLLLSIEDSTTISIDGDWGSGKTFFVKQVKLVLEAYNSSFKISNNDNESDDINEKDREQIKQVMSNIDIGKDFLNETLVNNPRFVVYYDAWENDDEFDPILSLIFRIVESINENFDIKIDFKIFDNIPGFKNLVSTIKDLKSIVKFNALLENQKQNNNLKQQIKKFLSSLLSEKGNKLIILIDELDRCSPSYAVKMLERIKHYFDDDNIIFVFSTDLSQLTHTIKKFYGEGYDSCRYLNRFFDLRLRLPEVDLEKYNSIKFRDIKLKGYRMINIDIDITCKVIIKKYNLSLRQINKFYKLLGIGTFNIFNIMEAIMFHMRFYSSFINPVAVALSIIDINKYNDFISGKDSTPLVESLKDLYNGKYKIEIKKMFLESDEYSNMNDEAIYLKLQERFEEMYEAIFVKDYVGSDDIVRVGILEFNLEIKKLIHDSLNLLSDLSYFEEQEKNSLN